MDNYRQHIWPFFEVGKLPSGEKRQEPGVHFDLTIEGKGENGTQINGETGITKPVCLPFVDGKNSS